MQYQNQNFNGEYDFRVRFHRDWKINEHLHEYSEFLYCKKGSCTVIINKQEIQLTEKQLAWISPNCVHQYDCSSAEVICAVFSNDYIPLFFNELKKRTLRATPIDVSDLSDLLENLLIMKNDDNLTICGYLNLISARVINQSTFDNVKYTDGILYQKVISYLSEHYVENITLSQIAKKFGYNEKYLSHTLHNLTGIHFRQLLTFYRLDHAKKLLRTRKEINITTIAAESGFYSINTFNRAFKEITGKSPSEYRDNYKN